MRSNLSAILLLLIFASTTSAQPPWVRGGDRGDSGRDWSRDRGDRDRGDWMSRIDPSTMLRRADKNGDGKVEPNEIDERFRGFTNRMLSQYGFDPSKPVNLDALSKKYQERRDGKEEEKKDEDVSVTFGIPGFDDVEESLPPLVPDFFLEADSPLLLAGPLESRYEKSILDQVDRTLRINDRNKDGIIDAEEIRRGRWDSSVSESDLNKDGKLSKIELAERYVKRGGGKGRIENGKKKSSSSRSSSSSSRSSSSRERSDSRREESKKSSSKSRSSSSRAGSSSSSSSSRNDKIVSYAKSILKKYDKNEDSILDKDESGSIRSLPPGADKNKDGKITLDELVVGFGGSASSSSGGSRSRSRSSANNPYIIETALDRSNEADRDFRELDRNVDGLIQMHEFTKSWTDEIARNFTELDKNNDGVVTVSEWSRGGGMKSSRSSRSSSSYRSRRDR
ncbi:MAG: hypothetical protein VX768_03790 [Planctomycetota bacterium]|nr:hypothetical protein [Planctomycetota bacterium]